MTNPAAVLASLQRDRQSCRAFRPESVPRADIEAILKMSRHAPSWCNTQPWQLIITEGAGTARLRAELEDFGATHPPEPDIPFPGRYHGIYNERRKACAWALYESVGIEHGDRAASARQTLKNFSFFGAPHLAIITTDRVQGTYGAVDCGIYVANFLLAAQSLGIACIAQAAIAAGAPIIRQHFTLPEDRLVLCGISFGYADGEDPANRFRTDRAEIASQVTWAPE